MMKITSSGSIRFGPVANLRTAHLAATVASLISILIFPPFGILLLICCLLSIGFASGVEVNFERRLYRKYSGFMSFYWGEWKNLPEMDYIAIVRKKQQLRRYRSNMAPGRTFYAGTRTIGYSNDINLIFKDSSPRYLTLTSVPLKKAYRISKDLSNLLSLKVLDSSSGNVTWMEN